MKMQMINDLNLQLLIYNVEEIVKQFIIKLIDLKEDLGFTAANYGSSSRINHCEE